MDITPLGEYGALGGILIIAWKGMDMVVAIFHEMRQKKNGSSSTLKLPPDFQIAATIKGIHQALDTFADNQNKLVVGQMQIVAAVQETGRQTVKAIADHNDNTERMARDINKVTREAAEK